MAAKFRCAHWDATVSLVSKSIDCCCWGENAGDLKGEMNGWGKHVAKKMPMQPLDLRQLDDAAIKDVDSTWGTNGHPQMRSCIST